MVRKQKDKGASVSKGNASKAWRLIERIAAMAHRSPGVTVQRNARLSSLRRRGKQKRKREIDVLLTGHVAGYPVQFPIECKDHQRPVDVMQIDSFIGKLSACRLFCGFRQAGI